MDEAEYMLPCFVEECNSSCIFKPLFDAKFKMAGPGHKLSESTLSSQSSAVQKKESIPAKRSGLSEESKVAAEAALSRLQSRRENPSFNTSLAAIQYQFLCNCMDRIAEEANWVDTGE